MTVIGNLNNGKSTGMDRIMAEMLKYGGETGRMDAKNVGFAWEEMKEQEE